MPLPSSTTLMRPTTKIIKKMSGHLFDHIQVSLTINKGGTLGEGITIYFLLSFGLRSFEEEKTTSPSQNSGAFLLFFDFNTIDPFGVIKRT